MTTCEGKADTMCQAEEASTYEICVTERTVSCMLESGDELTRGRFWEEAARFYEEAGSKLKAAALRTPDSAVMVKLSRFRLYVEAEVRAVELRVDWSTELARYTTASQRLDVLIRDIEDVRAKHESESELARPELANLVALATTVDELRRRVHLIGAETRTQDARALSDQGIPEAAIVALDEAAGHHRWLAAHETVTSIAETHLEGYTRASSAKIRLLESASGARRRTCTAKSEVLQVVREHVNRRGELQRTDLRARIRRLQMESDRCWADNAFDEAVSFASEHRAGRRSVPVQELHEVVSRFTEVAKRYNELVRKYGISSTVGDLNLSVDEIAGWVARARQASMRASEHLQLRQLRPTSEGVRVQCEFNALLRDLPIINAQIARALSGVRPLVAERDRLIVPGAVMMGTALLLGTVSAGIWGWVRDDCATGGSFSACARPRAVTSFVMTSVASGAGLTGAILLTSGLYRQKRRTDFLRKCFVAELSADRNGATAQLGCRF